MEIIDQLAVALGFATLAGINLYLTAFVTGLAVRMQWLILSPEYHELSVLGSDLVLVVAGALMVVEVMADKVPWVDSVWDSFHTLIRPVGGGLMAISTLGTVDPEFQVVIGLVAGGATMVSHGFKAGTRLVVNNSPEPVSNFAVSAIEDTAVIGGLALMSVSPKTMAVVCVIFLAFAIFIFPKMFRRIRGFYWLLYQNLFGTDRKELTHTLNPDEDLALSNIAQNTEVLWTAQVLTGKSKGLPGVKPWLFGRLVAVRGQETKLYFVGRRWRQHFCLKLGGEDLQLAYEPGLLSERISIYDRGGSFQVAFRMPRSQAELAKRVVIALREILSSLKTPALGPVPS
mgnify:CR=1 FL=1|tara:strand:- start:3926 stop:4954 length:1029 start_codon:yes stop_codon:yes gene_type:complete